MFDTSCETMAVPLFKDSEAAVSFAKMCMDEEPERYDQLEVYELQDTDINEISRTHDVLLLWVVRVYLIASIAEFARYVRTNQ